MNAELPCPDVVVVGAASRDIDLDDPRGWRLGGAVCYVSLGLARLGLRVGACMGLDRLAAQATELDLLREAGVDLHAVSLRRGPVFDNREGPDGRVQLCLSTSQRLPPAALPERWAGASALVLAPVAAELADAWAEVQPEASLVALGWQGALRRLRSGARTASLPPHLSKLVARADLVAVSRDDVAGTDPGDALEALLGSGGRQIAVTAGRRGGLLVWREQGRLRGRRYPALPARTERDLTGVGDAFLAGWVTGILAADAIPGRGSDGRSRPRRRPDLRALSFAALVASLKVEGYGVGGLPDRATVASRARELADGAGTRRT